MIKTNKPFIVYCHINKINGKRYIGITSQQPKQRFRNGNGYKSSPHFYSAIQKYGWNNFTNEIWFKDLNEENAKEKEIELIKKFKTRDKQFGYNLTPGGEGYSGEDNPWYGKHHSDEAKRKMSEKSRNAVRTDKWKSNISNSLKGRTFSAESKLKMSQSHSDVNGKNNPNYGKKLSKERIAKLVESSNTPEAIAKMKKHKVWYSGKENPNSKKVMCINTGKVYNTMTEAAIDTGCDISKISAVCHGKRSHTKQLSFKLMEDKLNE